MTTTNQPATPLAPNLTDPANDRIPLVSWLERHGGLVAILLLAAAIRLWGLERQGPWLDELHSMWASDPDHPWTEPFRWLMKNDTHLPLYFTLLRLWMWVGGMSEVWIRLLSVLIGLGGVWAMAHLGESLRSRRFGLLLALLTSVFYFHVYHSMEIRFYGLTFLLSTLSFTYFLRYMRGEKGAGVWWGVTTALGLCTFYSVAYVVVAQGVLYALIVAYGRPHRDRRELIRMGLSFAGFAAISATFLSFSWMSRLVMTSRHPTAKGGYDLEWFLRLWAAWMGLDDWGLTVSTVVVVVAMGLWAVGLIWVVSTAIGEWRRSSKSGEVASEAEWASPLVLVTWLVVALTLALTHGMFSKQPLFARYYIVVLAPVLALAGEILRLPRSGLLRETLALVGVIALSLNALVWPGAANYPKDGHRLALTLAAHRLDSYPVLTNMDQQLNTLAKSMGLKAHATHVSSPEAASTLAEGEGFWVYQLRYFPINEPALDSALRAGFELVKRYDDLNYVDLELYQRRPSSYEPPHQQRARMPQRYTSLPYSPTGLVGWVDRVDSVGVGRYAIMGWAALDDFPQHGATPIELALLGDTATYKVPTFGQRRRDIRRDTRSGFEAVVDLSALPPGRYRLGLIVSDPLRGRIGVSGPIGEFALRRP